MLRRLTAARATKKPSRATPFVGFFSATFLLLLKLIRSFFIATAKMSYTWNVKRQFCWENYLNKIYIRILDFNLFL
jgi:hypothetical protein